VRMDGFYLAKRVNGDLYLVRIESGRLMSAAAISPEIWDKLAALQRRHDLEHRAWEIARNGVQSRFRSEQSAELVGIVDSIKRSGPTGQKLDRLSRAGGLETIRLEYGGAKLATEALKEFGWPFWYNQKKFEETVAAL